MSIPLSRFHEIHVHHINELFVLYVTFKSHLNFVKSSFTFYYHRVEVGEVFATASGQSKKKAKHCAAKVLIEKIVEDDCGPLVFLK